jgi:hypothetical protein
MIFIVYKIRYAPNLQYTKNVRVSTFLYNIYCFYELRNFISWVRRPRLKVAITVPVDILNNFKYFYIIIPIVFGLMKKNLNRSFRYYSNDNKNKLINWYLAGLIEGDGHLNVPKVLRNSSGRLSRATIEVIFALKDAPSAEFLKRLFGGNLFRIPNKNCIKWAIQDKNSVTFIVNCINGKFRTPKINALHKLIDFLNEKGDNIIKLPLDNSPLESNAWLAGFIDSDGSFSIKGFSSSNLRTYLGFQLYLGQRVKDVSGESLEKVMQILGGFLKTKLITRSIRGFVQFVVNTSSKESNLILVNYLKTYPLLSSKYLDYKDWEKALNFYVNKLHKDPEHLEKIKSLKENMNTRRTKFNWSHLENSIYK